MRRKSLKVNETMIWRSFKGRTMSQSFCKVSWISDKTEGWSLATIFASAVSKWVFVVQRFRKIRSSGRKQAFYHFLFLLNQTLFHVHKSSNKANGFERILNYADMFYSRFSFFWMTCQIVYFYALDKSGYFVATLARLRYEKSEVSSKGLVANVDWFVMKPWCLLIIETFQHCKFFSWRPHYP